MRNVWQLQEAKNKFSKVVENALRKGPQTITRRGEKTVVVLSISEYQKLRSQEGGLADFLKNSPLRSSGLEIERDSDTGRDIDL